VTREATAMLLRLDVARWEPAAADVLAHQSQRALPALPLSFPANAHVVLSSAQRIAAIVQAARTSEGGAVSAAEARARADVLRDLDAAARRGIEAACSGGERPA
jgi:hypothetical protein